jgi:Tol biopolymer transport system component
MLTGNRWNRVGQARWSGDSLFLTAAETAAAPAQIWQITVTDGVATRITQDLNDYSGLSLTADGSRLSVIQEQRLSRIEVGNKQIVAEVGYIEELAWMADGRIAYVAATGDLWTINADGGNARQLTAGVYASRGFAVSPNGSRFVFSSDRSGKPNLWLANADGSGLTQITFGERDTYPQFTADGATIVFQRGHDDPSLWRISADGGEPVKFSENVAARPAVSADGKFVAYKYLDGRFERSRWSIGIMSSEGGPQLMRFDFPSTSLERYVRFAPDGRSVAFPNTVNGASEIWLQPLKGGTAKRLTDLNSSNIQAFDWSRDGKNVATIRTAVTRDVVLLRR